MSQDNFSDKDKVAFALLPRLLEHPEFWLSQFDTEHAAIKDKLNYKQKLVVVAHELAEETFAMTAKLKQVNSGE